jgi:hexosaminidase
MKYCLLFLSLLFCLSACVSENPVDHSESDYNLIPHPQNLKAGAGYFSLSPETTLIFDSEEEQISHSANYLHDFLQTNNQISLSETGKSNNSIRFELEENTAQPEAYTLIITQKGVLIRGSSPAGIFRGTMTLIQLISQQSGQKDLVELPCVFIEDEPAFTYRGMHLDVGRHFFPVDFIKKYIDLLAFYKMNRFHWHLTEDQGWRIEIKQYPKLQEVAAYRKETLIGHYSDQPHQFDGQRYGGYYTQEEVKEVVQYAKKRFITIIPEIELPGHSRAALAAYPELGCTGEQYEVATKWGVFPEVYCPKEETFEFLENVFTEVMDLFPSEYIHIGGDECPKEQWKNSTFCQELMQKEGLEDEHELQSYFIRRIEKFLNSKGRQIIGWDEILEGGLAPNATVMSWRGESGGIEAAKEGHDVVMTPTSHCYFDYYQSIHPDEPLAIGGYLPLEKVYHYHPVPKELTEEEARHILGAQGNVWTEYMKTPEKVEYMAFPRAIALAEVTWTGEGQKDFGRFTQRLTQHIKWLEKKGVNVANHLYDIKTEVIKENGVALRFFNQADAGIIRYSLSHSVTADDQAVTRPIPITQSGVFTGQAFINGQPAGRAESIEFNWHKAAGAAIEIAEQPAPQYSQGGKEALINGVLGSNDRYGDAEWLGFSGKNLDAVIDLGKTDTLHSVSFRFYHSPGQWIHAPKLVKIAVSNSEETPEEWTTHLVRLPDSKISNRTVELDAQLGQYLHIEVVNYGIIPEGMQGAENGAWLFIDEIIVE